MGQYYKPVILKDNKKTVVKFMRSWDYSNGSKLMEHSWIGNNFVRAFETLIFRKPQIVVWAGDYADECKARKSNIYQRCLDKLKVNPLSYESLDEKFRYVINHDKKLFVDKTKVPKITASWVGDDDYRIHPLPLLTSEGNGRGGGDFFGKDPKRLVGSWARQLISIDDVVPEGYTELSFKLIEK